MIVKNIWLEEKIKLTKALCSALEKAVIRFMKFNECKTAIISDKFSGGFTLNLKTE